MHKWVIKTLAASGGKSDREVRHSESAEEGPQGARCDPARDRGDTLNTEALLPSVVNPSGVYMNVCFIIMFEAFHNLK